ncbi:MAG TPA: OmpA family protein [Tepidisphaeraceae bacterium]|nr:OmpA family protein [Tepidisphaeraceae bacterium]
MRMTWFGMTAVLLGMTFLSVGCQNSMKKENDALWQQNRELQARLADSESKLRTAPDPAELQSMRDEIAKRDAEIADLKTNLQKQTPGQPNNPGLEGIDARYDAAAGTITVLIPGSVLFDSGRAIVKTSAKSTLDKIAAAIKKSYPSKRIYVDGHTDTDPIHRTKQTYDDNFDLAYARAHSVASYLETKGISDKQLVIRSYGANNAKGSKDASRRVEIVVKVK